MAQRLDPQIALGEVIRSRREELDKTQEAIALAADTDQARISRVEAGDNPSYGLAVRIAHALGWTLAELVRRVEALERGRPTGDDHSGPPSSG
jgi:transcriptional regulator with XRE-family HTH domain